MKEKITDITESQVRKLLTVLEAGLSSGLGKPAPGQMCVEAAVCYALGLPHGDDPGCVADALRTVKIRINDDPRWLSPMDRARGMRGLAVVQLGSRGALNEVEFQRRMLVMIYHRLIPGKVRAIAKRLPTGNIRAQLESVAGKWEEFECDTLTRSLAHAIALTRSLAHAIALTRAFTIDLTIALTLTRTLTRALTLTHTHAIAHTHTHTHTLALALALALALELELELALNHSVAAAAEKAKQDSLLLVCEETLKILVELQVPGCQWLPLLEEANQ